MKLVRLTPETDLDGFDCGDEDLNNFLVEDAKGFLNKRIATSFYGRKNETCNVE